MSVQLFLQNFSALLKNYRINLGLTQQELAQKLKTSIRSYQRIESGESEPSLSQLYRLSRELNFDFKEIFKFQESISAEQKFLIRNLRLLRETNRISRVGGWEIDLATNKITMTEMAKEILEVQSDANLQLEEYIKKLPDKEGQNKNRNKLSVRNEYHPAYPGAVC